MWELTEALGGGTLEQVVNGGADDDALAAGVDSEATDLDAVATGNVLHEGSLAGDLDELLAGVTVLVKVANVTGCHLLGEGNADGVVDTLEPDSHVGDEGNAGTELGADLTLVDVVSQTVGDDVVGEEVDIVLGAGLGSSARVTGDTEGGGLAAEEGNERSNAELGSSGVAAGVGNAGGTGNLGPVNELGQTVGPLVVETVVGAQVNDNVTALGTFVNGINEGLADTIRQSHNPAVDVTVSGHLADVIGAEILVDNLALLVALELLASELTGGDVAEIHVGVGVEQADQSLACVAAGANEGNLGGLGVGGVLLTKGRVRVGGSIGAESIDSNGRALGSGSAKNIAGGRERTLLLSRGTAGTKALVDVDGGLVSAVEAVLKVDITEHLAAVLGELLNELLNLLTGLDTVPEQNLAITAQAAVGLVEEPCQVLVIFLDGPSQLGEVLLEAGEDIVGHVGQPARLGDGEGSKLSNPRVLLGQDNSESVHGVIVVDLEVALLQALNVTVNDSAGIQTLTVTDEHILQDLEILELREGGVDVNLVAAADQGTGTGVGEQLLLEIGGVDDGNAGGAGKVAQELLHLLDLQTSTVTHPPLSHQVVVLLVKIDGGDLLTGVAVEQTTLLGKVDNLQRLQRARQLACSDIGVDIKNLPIGSLSHGGQDREAASGNSRLDRLLVDTIDLADQVVFGLVEVVGGEDARGDGAGTDTLALQLLNQLHVLLQEQLACQRQSLPISNPDSILELGLDTGGLQHAIELGTGAVNDDRVKTDMVEEGERG